MRRRMVQSSIASLKYEGVSGKEFRDMCERINSIIEHIREYYVELSDMLSVMSVPQIQQIKRNLRGILKSEHIDRLVLYGRGKLPLYLASAEKSLPAPVCRRLSYQAIQDLKDAQREVPVYTKTGVIPKRLDQMTPIELQQVVDPDNGIRTPSKQKTYCVSAMAAPSKVHAQAIPEGAVLPYFRALPNEDDDVIVIYGRTGIDGDGIGISIPLAQFRRLAKDIAGYGV